MAENRDVIEQFKARIMRASHAIQTGVRMDHDRGSADGSAKHLRTGVNIALVEASALGRLLIEKKIVTETEYWRAMALAYEDEVKRYERHLNLPDNVRLG